MKIHSSIDRPTTRWTRFKSFRSYLILLLAFILFLFSFSLLAGGAWLRPVIAQKYYDLGGKIESGRILQGLKYSLITTPANYIKAATTDSEIKKVFIDIKFKHIHKLQEKRAAALKKGVLISEPDDYVPAKIRYQNRSLKAKLRLKGDWTDHLESDKWSFRIHIKGKDQLFGMRRFSLQAPKVRGWHSEALFQQYLRQDGILAPRYFFVNEIINGKDIGIMAFEEHFSKELLESQGRREGVILKIDDKYLWQGFAAKLPQTFPFFHFTRAPIEAFRSGQIAKSLKLSSDLALATGLLRGFLQGKLPASSVFHPELWAKFIAAHEVWNSCNGLTWINLHFYFNPVTALLEPIGFDASLQNQGSSSQLLLCSSEGDSFTGRILKDPLIRDAFLRNLNRLAGEMLKGETAERLRPLEDRLLLLLRKEFLFLQPFDFENLKGRAKQLVAVTVENYKTLQRDSLPSDSPFPLVLATTQKNRGKSFVEISNPLEEPVEVIQIQWRHKHTNQTIPFTGKLPLELPITLPVVPQKDFPKPIQIPFQVPEEAELMQVEIIARVKGDKKTTRVQARPYHATRKHHPWATVNLEQALSQHPFMSWDEQTNQISVKPGTWKITTPLILPLRLGLHIPAGTQLQFGPKASLITRGPLVFVGKENEPILLQGIADRPWQGILALESGEPHRWSHVTVRNTSGIELDSFSLSGGTTFYGGEVFLNHCLFSGNRAEDALNIVRSRFSLKEVSIKDSQSDALDADFSEGIIKGGLFTEIGGDGIDVSGTQANLEGIQLRNINDKAISVGENSKLSATQVSIENVGTGLASKDLSETEITDSKFTRTRVAALMAYQKKNEYGPSRILASRLTLSDVSRDHLAQTGSRIVMDGVPVPTEDFDVDQLYKTGPMKK
ncbi:MAG: hypothetical protein VYC17_05475 [Nitrospinota bacterium]|nr:hypothetical protein [Nitrospinota bacterium]